MFGRKKREDAPAERPAPSRQSRAGLYAMCGLYLGYLFFQLIDPYFTPRAARPPHQSRGRGAVALRVLAWRIYWTPPAQDPEEETALPEAAEEDGEDKETEEPET